MASQSWSQLVASMPIQGQLYNTFTTAKSLLTSTASEASQAACILPSGFFRRNGRLKITAEFGLSNIVTTPGTLTLQVMVGGIIAFTTGALFMTTTANTLLPVRCEINLTCQKEGNGTTAQLMGQAFLWGQNVAMATGLANGAANTGWAAGPATSPALGTGFDSTIANTLDFQAAFSISNAGNGIQLAQYMVESWGNTAD
jgi:hypothetical protein